MALRLLVVEGNTRAPREAHAAGFYGKTPARAYADVLEELAPDAVCDICTPTDADAELPGGAGLGDYDGIVLTGSNLHIYQESPQVRRQIDLASAAFASHTAFFGSCWGLQVATVASGGTVERNRIGREAGIARNIAPTLAGMQHLLLRGRPAAFDAPCVHFDHVTRLPPDAVVLASNRVSNVQAAEIRHEGGTFWGVQYHPEYGLEHLASNFERGWQNMVDTGHAADQPAVMAHAALLRALHADPGRADIAWQLGIEPEILDPSQRLTELRNWLEFMVRSQKSQRGRA